MEQFVKNLTPYSPGSFKELFSLTLPLVFTLFSGMLMGFCDRVFLGHYSLIALEGVSLANYLLILFQIFCMRLSSMNQVLIGRSLGNNRPELVGPYTWQAIWSSFGTMLLTFPVSLIIGKYYFLKEEVGVLGQSYFSIMMMVHFLFPLGASLSGFFLGIGKARILTYIALLSHLLNIGLDYLLIFGSKEVVPELGVKGAAIATAAAQAFFCLLLFFFFIKELYAHKYCTRTFSVQGKLFWEFLRLGFPRSLAKTSQFLSWVCAVRLISTKGEDYILILSIGSSICLLFTSINEALGQTLISLFSFFHGRKEWISIWATVKSALLFVSLTCLISSILLLFFQNWLIGCFVKDPLPAEKMKLMILSCYWIWMYLFWQGLAYIPVSLLTAIGKTFFLLKVNPLSDWMTNFLLLFLAFEVWCMSSDKVWLLCSVSCIVSIVIYSYKVHSLYKEREATLA